ncbi:hypothetical protein QYF61_002866 [Mycteria americana]|uniref:Uncharacterized protein n=1 Tax=Mycteria americana TaxID=33587 RepID=A0AAN7N6N7_MYCAM|nr:hypothetical protein QYF61_002866 [Mycteria americana]
MKLITAFGKYITDTMGQILMQPVVLLIMYRGSCAAVGSITIQTGRILSGSNKLKITVCHLAVAKQPSAIVLAV